MDYKEICRLIPHRPPFLWVDQVLELNHDNIRATKQIASDLDLFQGHYPHYPIMPGVLLCEAVFQTGALLVASMMKNKADNQEDMVPVLTRIINAKFKREVHPGDAIEMIVKLDEQLDSVWFMKGKVLLKGKVAVKVKFSCKLIQNNNRK